MNCTSGFDFSYGTTIGMLFCIVLLLPNFIQIGPSTMEMWCYIHFSRWQPLVSKRTFLHLNNLADLCRGTTNEQFFVSVHHRFQLRFWPHCCNCYVILRQNVTLQKYCITHGGDMTSYRFSRRQLRLLSSNSGFLFVDVTNFRR